MAQWLRRVSQRHKMHCHDIKLMGSNPGRIELMVCGASVLVEPKTSVARASVYMTLCKKASNHHANLPLEMYSFTL